LIKKTKKIKIDLLVLFTKLKNYFGVVESMHEWLPVFNNLLGQLINYQYALNWQE